ncbi:MAG: phosphatase [Acidimicrobiia bacterium]|nr:phosphatase [Acidimicrobiia bacterium]
MLDQSFVPAPSKVRVHKAPHKILRTTRPAGEIIDRPDLCGISFQNKLIELKLAGKQTGMSTQIFRESMTSLARRDTTATMGINPKYLLHALDAQQIEDCATEVYGIELTKNKIYIDVELCEIAIDEASERLLDASIKGAKILFASSRPSATLALFSKLAVLAQEYGANILDSYSNTSKTIIDGRSGRNLTWCEKVCVVCEEDTMSLLGTNDTKIADDLFFHLPRPDLVVSDNIFAAGALTSSYPTISFIDLESLSLSVASVNEKNSLVVPINLSRPSSHYEIVYEYFKNFFEN